jgi:proteasome activator subunit 4
VWSGLPTLYQEDAKEVVNSCLNNEYEVAGLLVSHIDVKAGFSLTDPKDPRYQAVVKHRTRYGEVIHRAATTLRHGTEGEDHIDAVLTVAKAIDVFLLEYGMTRGNYDGLQKNYSQARE